MTRRILTVRFDVTGLSPGQIDALAFEASVQGEASDNIEPGHPDVPFLGSEVTPPFEIDPSCKTDHEAEDCEECGTKASDPLDAEAEYGRDTERDYDPDEDRTP